MLSARYYESKPGRFYRGPERQGTGHMPPASPARAEELDQAAHAPEDAADLNPLLSEFNDRQILSEFNDRRMGQEKHGEPSPPDRDFRSRRR